jgi:hypothetical protein
LNIAQSSKSEAAKDMRQAPKSNWKRVRFRVGVAFTILWIFLVGALTLSTSPLMVHRAASPTEIAGCVATHAAADALDRFARELSCKAAPSANMAPNYRPLVLAAVFALGLPALVFVFCWTLRTE